MLGVQQLRAFIAVFENGTVTGAAASLGRTQPQVSRLISSLEAGVGFPLFVRERRRLVPTQRGARFYDEVKPALDGLDNIARLGEEIRRDTEAVLRILVPPYAAHTILPRALARFCARYPERRYSVEILARNAMGSWITFHPFDVGVAALPFEIPAIKVKRFAAVETVVVMPKGHPLARQAHDPRPRPRRRAVHRHEPQHAAASAARRDLCTGRRGIADQGRDLDQRVGLRDGGAGARAWRSSTRSCRSPATPGSSSTGAGSPATAPSSA